MHYKNGIPKRVDIEDGYLQLDVNKTSGALNAIGYYAYICDYLGSVRQVCNAMTGDVVRSLEYYPSGLIFRSTNYDLQSNKYTGKELISMHGLNQYDSDARMQEFQIPHFTTRDLMCEKYYDWSPYVYCANNPVNFVDPDGREISFSYEWEKDKNGEYIINKNGGYNLIGVTMNVTGKVINISSNSNINMADATKRITSQIESSFSGQDDNGITFSTNVNLSVANSMNDIAESDHVFALADIDSPLGGTVQGVANSLGGKVAFVNVDYFTGPLDTNIGNVGPGVAAHEFGHLAGLNHSSGLMMERPGGILWMRSTKMNSKQLQLIHSNYKNGFLNQGDNWEYVRYSSPSVGGAILKKKPNRGRNIARSCISY